MDIKGQGALEYLLLIGGAVLVAAIVIALITGIPGGTPNPTDSAICAAEHTFAGCSGATVGAGSCQPTAADGTVAAGAATFSYCVWTST